MLLKIIKSIKFQNKIKNHRAGKVFYDNLINSIKTIPGLSSSWSSWTRIAISVISDNFLNWWPSAGAGPGPALAGPGRSSPSEYKLRQTQVFSIRRLETTAVGHTFKQYLEQQKTSLQTFIMYFVSEQFYQIHSDGLISLISSLLWNKSTSTKSNGPSLMELHLEERNQQRARDEKKRRQG